MIQWGRFSFLDVGWDGTIKFMRVRVSTEIVCKNSGNVAEFWFVLGHLLGSAIGVELL